MDSTVPSVTRPNLDIGYFGFPLFVCLFTEDFTGGEYQVIVLLICCDDADLELFAKPVIQIIIFYIVQGKFGSGNETADAFQISDNA